MKNPRGSLYISVLPTQLIRNTDGGWRTDDGFIQWQ